jgi:hypothetical protein
LTVTATCDGFLCEIVHVAVAVNDHVNDHVNVNDHERSNSTNGN